MRNVVDRTHQEWLDHGWDAAADGMSLVVELCRAQQLLTARIDSVLKPFGLTFARYEILMLLSFTGSGAMQIVRMGDVLQVHATSVTSSVNRLERDGHVLRRPHPTDGRSRSITITTLGRQVARGATTALNAEVFEDIGVSQKDVERLWRGLRSFRRNAGDF